MKTLLALSALFLQSTGFALNLNCSLITYDNQAQSAIVAHQKLESVTVGQFKSNQDDRNANLVYGIRTYPQHEAQREEKVASAIVWLEDRKTEQSATQWLELKVDKPNGNASAYRTILENKKGLLGTTNVTRADLICTLRDEAQAATVLK